MTHRYSQDPSGSPFRSFSHNRHSFANNTNRVDAIDDNVRILLDVHELTAVPQHEGEISAFKNFAHELELKTVNGQFYIISFHRLFRAISCRFIQHGEI